MHPELLSSLVAERQRDLAAIAGRRAPSARVGLRAPRVTLPRFRVSWTRTTLATVTGDRRGRSLVIVISATRPR